MVSKIDFTYPTKENCEYLESLNLSYKEMVEYFSCKITINNLEKHFRKFGIYHKTKLEALACNPTKLKNILFSKSIRESMIKYKCSKNVILNLRKEYKMKLDSRIINALDTLVYKLNYYNELWLVRSLVRNTSAEVLYKTENFPSNDIWTLMVDLFGDYKSDIKQGWLNIFKHREEIITFIDAITKTAREAYGFIHD